MGRHTEARLRRIARIKELQRIIEQRMKHWLAELESNMRTPSEAANQVCRSIARELQKMRPHADEAELPSFAELAGSLAVLANRPRSLDWKLHELREGVGDLKRQLEHALEETMSVEFGRKRSSE